VLTTVNQRWRDRRDTYRPAGETINTAEFEVAAIDTDRVAKAFVVQHHYSATYPAARFRFGLYRGGDLAGVAVFSHPCSNKVLTSVFPGEAKESVELGRFVLLDNVAGNGETWFLARCFEQLRGEGLRGVVSFSDPIARTDDEGQTIFPGHVGTIYQASNGVYLGRGTARTLRILPNGTVFSDRAIQKIRAGEQGWVYSAEILEAFGAPKAPEDAQERLAWLQTHLALLTRPLRHVGNHKYAWAFQKADRKRLPTSLPYPKIDRLAA